MHGVLSYPNVGSLSVWVYLRPMAECFTGHVRKSEGYSMHRLATLYSADGSGFEYDVSDPFFKAPSFHYNGVLAQIGLLWMPS